MGSWPNLVTVLQPRWEYQEAALGASMTTRAWRAGAIGTALVAVGELVAACGRTSGPGVAVVERLNSHRAGLGP